MLKLFQGNNAFPRPVFDLEDIMFLRAFTLAQVGFSFSRPHSSGLFGKAEATIKDCALNCNVGTSE